MEPTQPVDQKQMAESFSKELKALLDKYNFALGASAMLTQDGRVTARVEVVQLPAKEMRSYPLGKR